MSDGITLNWVPLPGADILSYRLYRSMVGFKVSIVDPSLLVGLNLILTTQGGTPQTITFSGSSSALDQINAQIIGAHAYAAADPLATYFFVRSDVRTQPGAINITGGTANALLYVTPRLITERSESILLATIPALEDETATVEYVDLDGVSEDFYAISTVNHLTDESIKSTFRRPIDLTGPLCVLEGIVQDLSGRRVTDAKVTATLMGTPQSTSSAGQISNKPIRTLSGPDGRYSLAVLQGATIRIDIPLTGYSREILVPQKQFMFVTDLGSDDSAGLDIDRAPGSY